MFSSGRLCLLKMNNSSSIKLLKRLYLVLACSTFTLVVLGGFVRATGAGLSCPDWPLCFGRVIPALSYGVAQEYFHRVLASIVSTGIFIVALISYRSRKLLPHAWSIARVLVLLLLIQVVLGGLTVLLQLNPLIVTAHLATGTLFLLITSLVAPTRLRFQNSNPPRHSNLRSWLRVMLILIFLQILLGGFVGSSGAALSCSTIPLCYEQILPLDHGGPVIVQMSHRILAVIIFSSVLVLIVKSWNLPLRSWALRLMFLILLQITLGVLNVVWQVPIPITVCHLLVAEGLLLSTAYCYLNFDSLSSPLKKER